MRILVISQYYKPEPFNISDICEELKRSGHSVTVITGVPNYPLGKVYAGYEKGKRRKEIISSVDVRRVFTVARRTGALFRFLNYISFALSSSAYIGKLKEDYDIVFVNQLSPVLMALAGIKYKKRHNKRLVLYCLDLWPESLTTGGIKKGGIVFKIFKRISEKIYRSADKLLVSSLPFKEYLKNSFEISEEKIEYLPQYADDLFIPQEKENSDFYRFTFSGNIGTLQSIETVVKTARLLVDRKDIRFNIVGEGSCFEECKAQAADLDNIEFSGRFPIESMPEIYKNSDALLVTFKDSPVAELTLPAKVQSYMASGRPIIASAGGQVRDEIAKAKCGICCEAENPEALKQAILDFCEDNNKEQYGKNARKYYEENFTKQKFIKTLLKNLEQLSEN